MPTPDKPTPPALNLDSLERQGAPEPFVIVLGGKRIQMKDAMEIDWQTLMVSMQNPHNFFKLIVPEKNHDDFFTGDFPTWKMRALMDRYTDHYGITDPGNQPAS